MKFWTSDTHFGHKNIINLSNRPFDDVQHMNESIITNWNSMVGIDDTVFHLGDVALGPWVEWDSIMTQLNGHKILVVGNHDRIFRGEKERMRERFHDLYNSWFDEVYDVIYNYPLANGVKVDMSHFPVVGDSQPNPRHAEFRPQDRGVPLIHGHTHLNSVTSRTDSGTIQIHVGMDAHNYTPVSEQQVMDYIRVAGDMNGNI